jgi:nicotinamide-nucleotide amidase
MVSEPGVRAAIVTVGNELLFGQTVDTNAAWLGRELASRGIPVVRRYTVGDVDQDIREVLAEAVGIAELVVVTGGLGPTPDDRTKAAVAAHLERPMVVDDATRRDVEARFRAAGLDQVPTLSVGQYEVPEGARVLRNPKGTAPGLVIDAVGTTIALFPGVPRELRAIFAGDFASELDRLFGIDRERLHHRLIHTTGLFETRLAEALEERLAELPLDLREGVALAYLPDLLGVDLRLSVRSGSPEGAVERFDAWLAGVADVLEPWRFEAPSGDLAEAVVSELVGSGRTLSVAESCTGGLVGARITSVPGSSEAFEGGVIAYSNESKVQLVGVSREALDRDGAVSERVARELAARVAERFGTEAGIGVTGVAGPGGGSPEKPVGTVWIGVTLDGHTEAFLGRYAGNRDAVRARAAQSALASLYRRLRAESRG